MTPERQKIVLHEAARFDPEIVGKRPAGYFAHVYTVNHYKIAVFGQIGERGVVFAVIGQHKDFRLFVVAVAVQ